MNKQNNISYLENSSYYPKINNNYIDIFKCIEIDDDYEKAFKIIKNIPPAKLLLFQVKEIFLPDEKDENKNLVSKLVNTFPNDIKNLLFIQTSLEWNKSNKSDKFEYGVFKERLILAYSLTFVLANYIEEFSRDEVFMISQFKNLGLLPVARCLPGVFNNYLEKNSKKPDIKIDEFMNVIPEELDVMLIEKWKIGSTVVPLIINYSNPRALGNNLEGIKLVKQSILINSILDILYKSDRNNKIKLIKAEIQSFLKNKENAETLLKEWLNVSRIITKSLNYELENFTNIFFNNLNVAETENKKLIIDDLKQEYLNLSHKYAQLLEENRILKKQASQSMFIDNVTKIYNHSYFFQFLDKEIQKSIRYEYPISLLFADIDFFHIFNETYGYNAGNSLLKELAVLISKNLRESDVFARYNNDDLIILLPHTGLNNAVFVAKKIQNIVDKEKLQLEGMMHPISTTISVGVSAIYPPYSYEEKDNIIKIARRALMLAKEKGGNRVEAIKV